MPPGIAANRSRVSLLGFTRLREPKLGVKPADRNGGPPDDPVETLLLHIDQAIAGKRPARRPRFEAGDVDPLATRRVQERARGRRGCWNVGVIDDRPDMDPPGIAAIFLAQPV